MSLIAFVITLAIVSTTFAQQTNFIDKESKIGHFFEPQWFRDNIPFVEVPIKEIEEVYYYRWSSHKRHLRYTIPGNGYVVTEFINNIGYSLKYDTINAAAGHHIRESRWLRDRRYAQDYINFWTRGGGDSHSYSEWIAEAAYNSYLVDGDEDFIKSQLEGLVRNYKRWDDHYNGDWKLYWISPERDAQELSCSSFQSDDPFWGGEGYRPSFNSEMYGNAIAISKIAALVGDFNMFLEFQQKAEDLKAAIMERLWDPQRKFFYHGFRDNNTNYELVDSREEVGFYPWEYNIPGNGSEFAEAWEQLIDSDGFGTLYGPTTCEVRSQYFDGNQTDQCCWWNGNSWPYSTSHTLKALAAQVRNYKNSPVVGVNEFVKTLQTYALTQYKNDKPYVAECHSPIQKIWVGDRHNLSEHYAHSTYVENVLADLLGVTPRPDNVFEINPLVPNNWRFFAVENLPYHGHEVTVLFDADGSYYESGYSGLQIFVNGQFIKSQPNIGPMSAPVPPPVITNGRVKLANYASNPNSQGYPEPSVSFNSVLSSPWHPLDGRIFYDWIPTNRWTSFDSGNPTDWYAINFGPGRAKNISQVKLYVYSDVATNEGRVDCPTKMEVEIYNGNEWIPAQNQRLSPEKCSPNDVTIIDFDSVVTQQVRVIFTRDVTNNYYTGITELEIWALWPQTETLGTFEAEDGLVIGGRIQESREASGNAFVGDLTEDGSTLEFAGVWADTPGIYSVQIFYSNPTNDQATHNLLVNDQDEQIVSYEPTVNDFETVKTIEVPLQRGNNFLVFKKGVNNILVDKIFVGDMQ